MHRPQRMIFVTSTAWLALYNPSDPNHEAASALWQDLSDETVRFVTTDYVMDQVFTVMKIFGSLDAARGLYTVITQTELLRFFMTDSVIFERAWKTFADDEHPQFTFTDCVNYAVIQYLGVPEVFTFDRNFTAPGLTVLPSSGDSKS